MAVHMAERMAVATRVVGRGSGRATTSAAAPGTARLCRRVCGFHTKPKILLLEAVEICNGDVTFAPHY